MPYLPDDLLPTLEVDEGFRAEPYQDTEGKWTVGFGTLIERGLTGAEVLQLLRDGITEAQARELLRSRAQERWDELTGELPEILQWPETVQAALANMVYQLGVRGVMLFKMMLSAMREGDWAAAAEHALSSKWATQTPNRAERVAEMIRAAA